MWTRMIDLVGAVLRFPISIIADEPAKCRQSTSCRLDVDHAFNDPAHIVSIANDSMQMKRLLSDVPSDRSVVGMPSIFSQIIQANTSAPQQCEACTAATVPGNPSFGICTFDPSPFTENGNQGFVDKGISDAGILITEKIINELTILSVEDLTLV